MYRSAWPRGVGSRDSDVSIARSAQSPPPVSPWPWTKMSAQFPGNEETGQTFVSFGTRFPAAEKNATSAPSSLIAGSTERSFACAPSALTLNLVVVPATRSRTKTSGHDPGGSSKNSGHVFVSPSTRLVDDDEKATNRPFGVMSGPSRAEPPDARLGTVPVALLLIVADARALRRPGRAIARTNT